MANDSDQFLATQIKLIQSDSVLRPVAQQYHLRALEKQGQDAPPERAIRIQRTPVTLSNLKVTRPPNTYLLLISYRSPDPDLAANVANAVTNSYLQRTFEIRYRATADLSTFMEKQLEELRAKMERSGMAVAQFERELNVIPPAPVEHRVHQRRNRAGEEGSGLAIHPDRDPGSRASFQPRRHPQGHPKPLG